MSREFLASVKLTAAVALTVILWAAAFPVIRFAVADVSPASVAVIRCILASGIFGALVLTQPKQQHSWQFSRGDLVRLAVAGAMGVGAYNLLLMGGEQTVPAGEASLLGNTTTVFAAILGTLFLKEKIRAAGWLAIGLSILGIALMESSNGFTFEMNRGFFSVLAAAFLLAGQWVIQKPLMGKRSAVFITACLIWAGTLLLAPFAPHAIVEMTHASPSVLLAVLFLAVGPSVIAYSTWSYTLANLPVGVASTFLYLIPPVSVAIAFLFLHEHLAANAVAGGAMTLTGIIVFNTFGKRSAKSKAVPIIKSSKVPVNEN